MKDDNLAKIDIFETLVLGSMGNYLHVREVEHLMQQVLESYGNKAVFARKFGTTLESREMWSYALMLGATEADYMNELE